MERFIKQENWTLILILIQRDQSQLITNSKATSTELKIKKINSKLRIIMIFLFKKVRVIMICIQKDIYV